MRTSVVAIYRWRWGICCLYFITVLLRDANCGVGASTTKQAEEGRKRVTFASPVVQGVVEVPRVDETASSAAVPSAPPLPRQEVLPYLQTVYPSGTEWNTTSTNATKPEPTAEWQPASVGQPLPAGWATGLYGTNVVGVPPVLQPFAALPTGLQFGTFTPPQNQNPAMNIPSMGAFHPTTSLTHHLSGPTSQPSSAASFAPPTDMLRPVSGTVPVYSQAPYMVLTHPTYAFGSGTAVPSQVAWPSHTVGSRTTAPAFTLPKGRQGRDTKDLMEEVRQQEQLRRSRNLDPPREAKLAGALTTGLTALGALVAAQKTAKGLAWAYRWARGINNP